MKNIKIHSTSLFFSCGVTVLRVNTPTPQTDYRNENASNHYYFLMKLQHPSFCNDANETKQRLIRNKTVH